MSYVDEAWVVSFFVHLAILKRSQTIYGISQSHPVEAKTEFPQYKVMNVRGEFSHPDDRRVFSPVVMK